MCVNSSTWPVSVQIYFFRTCVGIVLNISFIRARFYARKYTVATSSVTKKELMNRKETSISARKSDRERETKNYSYRIAKRIITDGSQTIYEYWIYDGEKTLKNTIVFLRTLAIIMSTDSLQLFPFAEAFIAFKQNRVPTIGKMVLSYYWIYWDIWSLWKIYMSSNMHAKANSQSNHDYWYLLILWSWRRN